MKLSRSALKTTQNRLPFHAWLREVAKGAGFQSTEAMGRGQPDLLLHDAWLAGEDANTVSGQIRTTTIRGSRAFGEHGHWGRAGAGVMLTTGTRVLVLLRSMDVTEPGTWNIAGGAVDADEDPLTAGIRELREETGLRISLATARKNLLGTIVWENPGSNFRYTTSIVRVPESMVDEDIDLNWENDEHQWMDEGQLQRNDELHPGLHAKLDDICSIAFTREFTGSRSLLDYSAMTDSERAQHETLQHTTLARRKAVHARLKKAVNGPYWEGPPPLELSQLQTEIAWREAELQALRKSR